MVECSNIFIGMDVSKDRHAVAVADGGRDGEVRYFGEIGSDGGSVRILHTNPFMSKSFLTITWLQSTLHKSRNTAPNQLLGSNVSWKSGGTSA